MDRQGASSGMAKEPVARETYERIKTEYLQWSGGFRPDEEEDYRLAAFVEGAAPADVPNETVWTALYRCGVQDQGRWDLREVLRA